MRRIQLGVGYTTPTSRGFTPSPIAIPDNALIERIVLEVESKYPRDIPGWEKILDMSLDSALTYQRFTNPSAADAYAQGLAEGRRRERRRLRKRLGL